MRRLLRGTSICPLTTKKGLPLLQSPVFKTMRPSNLEQTRAAFRDMELLPSYTPWAHGLLVPPRPLARPLMATFIPQPCGQLWLLLSRSHAVSFAVRFLLYLLLQAT